VSEPPPKLTDAELLRPVAIGALAGIHLDRGMVHDCLGDDHAVVESYLRCVALTERLRPVAGRLGSHGVEVDLATALIALHNVLARMGRRQEALGAARGAVKVTDGLAGKPGTSEVCGVALHTLALATGDRDERIWLLRSALVELERGSWIRSAIWAMDVLAREEARAGRAEAAEDLWNQVDAALAKADDSPVSPQDRQILKALTLNARAALSRPSPAALGQASEAMALLTALVHRAGRRDLVGDLGHAMFLAARYHEDAGGVFAARELYRAAHKVLEGAVEREGRMDLAGDLARACDHEATLNAALGDHDAAIGLAVRAVEIWERLRELDGIAVWRGDLAEARSTLAALLIPAGDLPGAKREIDAVLALLGDSRADLDRHEPITLALALNDAARIAHRSGDWGSAVQHHQRALELLRADRIDAALHARSSIAEDFGKTLHDLHEYQAALAVFDDSVAMAQAMSSGRRASRLFQVRHARVSALVDYGDFEGALGEVTGVLQECERLVTEGQIDLHPRLPRLHATLGLVLLSVGDAAAAAAAWQMALPLMEADQSAQEATRGIRRNVKDTKRLLAISPRDVPVIVEQFHQDHRRLSARSRDGQVEATGWFSAMVAN
jgi:tetratricopeptide (TPR) repeat protein